MRYLSILGSQLAARDGYRKVLPRTWRAQSQASSIRQQWQRSHCSKYAPCMPLRGLLSALGRQHICASTDTCLHDAHAGCAHAHQRSQVLPPACSTELSDKRTALLAIEELIKAKVTVENSVRINALARSIKTVMNSCSDNRILKQCAQVRSLVQDHVH